MSSPLEPKLTELVRRCTGTKPPCVKLIVRHVPAAGVKAGADVLVQELRAFDSGTFLPVEEVVRAVIEAVEADANGLGRGTQQYVVLPMRDGSDRAMGRLILNVRSEEVDDEDEGVQGSEAPNAAGVLRMVMRHQDSFVRVSSVGNTALVSSLNAHIMRLDGQLRDQGTELAAARKELHETRMKSRELDALERLASTKEKRTDELMRQFGVAFPHLLHRLTGGQGAPPGWMIPGGGQPMLPPGPSTSSPSVIPMTDAEADAIAAKMTEADRTAFLTSSERLVDAFGRVPAPPSKPSAGHGQTDQQHTPSSSTPPNGSHGPETPPPSKRT